ncbi:hypothetical protein BDZ94DRAFT_1303188 [Collybia nuda]|uniref:Uncharacterized protein n=1 Tax=Collybia nuda TaxID=64659 RepID=A0A9P5YKG9_9AGAR|nr:hypothetical protein BDZ94DRAFT_1303188 [Collybia nuda]
MPVNNTPQHQILQLALASYGETLLVPFLGVMTLSILYGLFIFIFAQLCVRLGPQKSSNLAHLLLFMASSISFLVATGLEVIYLVLIGISVHSALFGIPGKPLVERPILTLALLAKPKIIMMWVTSFQFLIGDIVVIWRAYVLLRIHRMQRLAVFPLLIFVSAATLTLSFLISISRGADVSSKSSFLKAGLSLSLGTNVATTALTGFVYWIHRKDMMAGIPRERGPTQVERVLGILVESGVLYCCLQAGFFALLLCTPKSLAGDCTVSILTALCLGLIAMQPTFVTLVVRKGFAFDNTYWMDTPLSCRSMFEHRRQPVMGQFSLSSDIETRRGPPQQPDIDLMDGPQIV